jgi:hypothetical protein
MARPKLDVNRKESQQITIYLTKAQKDSLQKEAESCALSLSTYLKKRIFSNKIVTSIPEVNRKAFTELSRIGVNLNQLARQLNSWEGSTGIPDKLTGKTKQIDHLLAELLHIKSSIIGDNDDR